MEGLSLNRDFSLEVCFLGEHTVFTNFTLSNVFLILAFNMVPCSGMVSLHSLKFCIVLPFHLYLIWVFVDSKGHLFYFCFIKLNRIRCIAVVNLSSVPPTRVFLNFKDFWKVAPFLHKVKPCNQSGRLSYHPSGL